MKEKDIIEIEVDGKRKVLEELVMPKHTTENTAIYAERDYQYNAPHTYLVVPTHMDVEEVGTDDENILCEAKDAFSLCIHFQEGPVNEVGVNGVFTPDLLNIVLCNLEHFQNSDFACEENARAIEHINAALDALRERTEKRRARGVLGYYKK